jgi:hypothetical protein
METNNDQTTNLTRFTVAQAADVLGLSAEAVRMRIKRGTLAYVKEENTVYVLLEPSSSETVQTQPNDERTQPNNDQTTDQTTQVVEALQAEVQFLRQELRLTRELREEEARRKDAIIMTMAQRIPELEPPSEPREAPSEVRDGAGKGEEGAPNTEKPPERSWLQRFFGL